MTGNLGLDSGIERSFKSSAGVLDNKVKRLPLNSGVYLFKDGDGKIIYVGKAVSLRKRVQSYFRKKLDRFKTELLVKHIVDLDFIETYSEAEALILEASLVKEHQPRFNIELKDGKMYPHIQITKEKYPRVEVVRLSNLDAQEEQKKGAMYYGPYINPGLIRDALHLIRRIFPFRMNRGYADKSTLEYDIGLREAPDIEDVDPKLYAQNIKNVKLILEGKKDKLYRDLRQQMENFAQAKKFEQAAKVRDQIRAIGALYSGTGDVNYFKEVEQLQRMVNLPLKPERIECFDISHAMGKQTVGSMVSFLNGKPDKSNYRRFRIKEVAGIDDFSSIAEVVKRRYRRLQKEGRAYPDLIVIDGGKGQLSAAVSELKTLGIDIPIISLAKQEEEIFLPRKRDSIKLRKDSLALQLLQRVRDEAHRFAIAYHRKLRGKASFE